ncbi:hypothetical protein D1007_00795 [Hordeum vulgare]|nr:hypothetical protein D1007_00795 [Hordeum vulgare]
MEAMEARERLPRETKGKTKEKSQAWDKVQSALNKEEVEEVDFLQLYLHLLSPSLIELLRFCETTSARNTYLTREVVLLEKHIRDLQARMAVEAAEAEAARNWPPPVPQPRTQAQEMAFLVSYFQGMEKNIQWILQNQKSHERVVETKFHDMDMKVKELNTIVKQLQHEVDSVKIPCLDDDDSDDDDHEESPFSTTSQFNTKPRSVVVPTP